MTEIIVFGGVLFGNILNDLWRYVIANQTWVPGI